MNIVPTNAAPVERFHSCGKQLCKLIGSKESVYIRKDFNSHKNGLVHQYGCCFIVFGKPVSLQWLHMKALYCSNLIFFLMRHFLSHCCRGCLTCPISVLELCKIQKQHQDWWHCRRTVEEGNLYLFQVWVLCFLHNLSMLYFSK